MLEAIDLDGVHADGYGFQIELTYRAVQAGFTVAEVPILFRERREGQSKMTARIALEAVWKVPALRIPALTLYFLKRLSIRDKEQHVAGNLDEVTDNNFQAEVLEADKPVLVDFWAPWCGPCRIIAPHLEELQSEREDLRVVKLNVDDNPQTAAQYNVMSIPMLLLFKNGQARTRSSARCRRAGSSRRSSRR